MTTPKRIAATWRIHLYTDCPGCKGLVDLLDDPDFWYENDIGVGEVGTPGTTNREVTCPACGHEFCVDTQS